MRVPYIFINSPLKCIISLLFSSSSFPQILVPINVKISNIPVFLNSLDVLSNLSSVLIQVLINILKDFSN